MRSLCTAKTFSILNNGISNSLRSFRIQFYSVFPPTFIKPVYHPDELKNLSADETRERLLTPTLPPLSQHSSSVFQDPLLQKFINHVMQGGRKAKAEEIVNEAFLKMKRIQVRKFHLTKEPEKQKKILTNPLEIFHLAVQNSKPVLDVTPVKKGGVMYRVPVAISEKKSLFLAIKWIVEVSREHEPRRNHTGEYFSDRLARELLGAAENTGKIIKRKLELHKLCEANKAYAHYRWS